MNIKKSSKAIKNQLQTEGLVVIIENNKRVLYNPSTEEIFTVHAYSQLRNIDKQALNAIVSKEAIVQKNSTPPTTTTPSNTVNQLLPVSSIIRDALSKISDLSRHKDTWINPTNELPWTMDAVIFKISEVIRLDYPTQRVTRQNIIDALGFVSEMQKQTEIESVRKRISFDRTVNSDLQKLLATICGEKYDPMYEKVIAAKIWSIKRSIYGLEKWNPFLLNFYGKENQGKGVVTKALFSNVLSPDIIGEVTNISESVNDSRFLKLFSDYNLVSIPELAGAGKNLVPSLKAILDREYVNQRVMGTNQFQKLSVKADVISSSNETLRDLFLADHNVRKWCEIELKTPTNTTELMDKVVYPLLGDVVKGLSPTIDCLSIWKSVDEQAPSPLYSCYHEYQRWTTNRCLYWSKVNLFIHDYFTNNPLLHSTPQYGDDIYAIYSEQTEDKKQLMGKRKFFERLELFGFVASKDNHNKTVYSFPKQLNFRME